MMNTFGKCTENQILEFEEKYRVNMPNSLKSFLMETNGILLDDGICISIPSVSESIYVDALFGIGIENKWLSMDYWHQQYGDELPPGTLIIGSDIMEGFILILNVPGNSGIYYWDDKLNLSESTTASNCYYICDSVEELINKLHT